MLLKHICPVCQKIIPIDKPCCDEHGNRHNRYDATVRYETDMRLHKFYTGSEWETLSKTMADRYSGICLWVYYKRNEIKPYDEVHHIIPLRDCWERRLDPDNLIPLSHAAHMLVEAEYRKGGKARMQSELFELKKRYEGEFFAPRGV